MTAEVDVSTRQSETGVEERSPLRARQDLLFAQVPDGALVRWGDSGYLLKGRTAYRWLASILPRLDGRHTIDDLVAGLDPARAASVRQIVRSLAERGVVQAGSPVQRASADPLDQQLAYVAHFVPDAAAGLERVRTARLAVVGDGPVAASCVASLLANGFDRVACAQAVRHAPPVRDELDRMRGTSRAPHLDGGTDSWDVDILDVDAPGVDAPGVDDGGGRTIELVLATDPWASPASVLELTDKALATGCSVLPITACGPAVLLGPLVSPVDGPEPGDGWERFLAGASATDSSEFWRRWARRERVSDPAGSELSLSLLGNLIAFEAFKYISGVGAETQGKVIVFDLDTTVGGSEAVLPLPRRLIARPITVGDQPEPGPGPVDGRPAPAVARSTTERTGDGSWKQRLETGWESLVGRHTGVIRDYDDLTITQSPLKIGRVLLAVPGRAGVRSVSGWSTGTIGDARDHAAYRAMSRYAVSVARRISGPTVPAWDLVTGQPVEIDRAVVLDGSGAVGIGTAAARSSARAAERALQAALSGRVLADLADRTGPPPTPLDLGSGGDDAELDFLLEVAGTMRIRLTAFARAHPGDAVTVVVIGARTASPDRPLDLVAAATAADRQVALRTGLTQVIAQAQAVDQGLADLTDGDDPEPVPGEALGWLDPGPPSLQGAPGTTAEPGFRGVRVDLTPDDLATCTGVTVSRVVLLPC